MKNIYESIILFFIFIMTSLEGAVEFIKAYKKRR
jgi:hypothetical protein